jgi:hypothetical protein
MKGFFHLLLFSVVAVSAVAGERVSPAPPQPLLSMMRAPRNTRVDMAGAVSPANPFLATSGRRFTIGTLDVANIDNATSADAPHEVLEPAVLESRTSYRSCRCVHTFDYTAFMHNAAPSTFKPVIRVAQKDLTTGIWQLTSNLDLGNQPGQVIPFDQSADPTLARQPESSGLNPARVYLAGTTLNRPNPTSPTPDTQVSVWYTDNGGVIWNRYPGIEYHHNSAGSNWLDDKPHIAVSSNPNNLGNVYLAFVVIGDPNVVGGQGIKLFRMTPASPTWQDMGYAVTGGTVQSPRIDVDPNDPNGTVYLTWIDWTTQTVNIKTSTTQGATWSSTSTISTGTIITNLICSNSALSNCLQAVTTLTTRWNTVAGRLEIVFHRRIPSIGGNSAEVVHTTFVAPGTWGSVDPVSSNSPSHYSWNGAIACATDGTCLVTFYDMDPNEGSANPGLNYRIAGRTLYTTSSDTILYNTSTPANPYAHGWTPYQPPFSTPFYTPGEYQDIVYFNGAYTAAAVYSTGGQNKNDIFVMKP